MKLSVSDDLIVFVIALGIFWGATYGAVETQFAAHWPGWLRGLAFASLPLFVSLLWLTPPAFGQPATSVIVLALGETFRWATYGILLGEIFPILGSSWSSDTARMTATGAEPLSRVP